MRIFTLFLLLFGLLACNSAGKEASAAVSTDYPEVKSRFSGELPQYWYQGKAELNTYDLQQARYGELHPGVATLVFVSEDFLTDKQVKNDRYQNPNSAPILKTNSIKRFTTGIYDYSVMSSVFSPTQTDKHPRTLKVTVSSQDWCGQSFAQLNYAGGDVWESQLRSYFESEGDVNATVNGDWLEDEIFNRIRLDPAGLPLGEQRVVPSVSYLLLTHKPMQAYRAVTSLEDYAGGDFKVASSPDESNLRSGGTGDAGPLKSYTIQFPDLDRELRIVFRATAPYQIEGWTDSYPSRGRKLTSIAKLKKRILEPYWEQNGTNYADRRADLGLGAFGE